MFRNLTDDATIEIYFETFASTGAPVAPSSAFTTSDFAIYKNGSATAKATTNGLTVTSPFNSETGCHLLVIDTSNDTGDAGFWTTGARYQVKFNTAKTVGSQSIDGVSVPRGSFGIQSEYMRGTDSAALASGVTVSAMNANVITAASIAADAITDAKVASDVTIASVTGSVGSVVGAVGSVTSGVTVTTNNDKTGYSLASDGLAAVTTWTVGIIGDITGNVSGSVGSVTGAVALDSAERNTLVDLVWDESMSGHTTAGTYGGRIVRATNSNTEVQITGSNHIAADVHELQTGVITANDFAANSITAFALATDAVTEIQNGLATAALITTMRGSDNDTLKTLSDQIDGIAGGGGDAAQATSEDILDIVTANGAKLDTIALKTALITAGRIRVLSRVSGSLITAKAGDDHLVAAGNALTLEIDDDDCAVYQFLKNATHTAIEFGAGQGTSRDEITADIDPDEITHVATQTFVPIELAAADTVELRAGEYSFDIQVTTSGGYKVTKPELEGTMVLTADRKS